MRSRAGKVATVMAKGAVVHQPEDSDLVKEVRSYFMIRIFGS